MYALVRKLYYDKTEPLKSYNAMEKFQQIYEAQDGYVGNLTIDAGSGCQIVINLWEDEILSSADGQAPMPEVQRLIEPLMPARSELVCFGQVIYGNIFTVDIIR